MDRVLGDPLTPAERAVMHAHARALLGVPWRHKGRSDRGIDCLGYAWLVMFRTWMEARGVRLANPADDYGRLPYNQRLRSELCQWIGDPVSIDEADIVTMRWGKNGEEHHVGVIVPHHFHGIGLIHADNTAAGGPRVVEHGIDYVWRRRLIEGWRL